jgi:hypothetical protein
MEDEDEDMDEAAEAAEEATEKMEDGAELLLIDLERKNYFSAR